MIRFRFLTILRTSTAMVSHPMEVPVSYLNKGHVYHLTVVDSRPPTATSEITKYRTSIRVSFEWEEQKSDPAAYWQLWKTARGVKDSQKSDNKVRALEYVGQDKSNTSIEHAGLDGFSITWIVGPKEKVHGCSIPIRFNFLSTDFTISKGVRGAPVRLCATTKQLGEFAAQEPEICFCKVKLFRDRGAERKLSNDVRIVRKKIEKLKRQMSEPAPPEPARRRKRGSMTHSKARLSYSKENLHGDGMLVRSGDQSRQTNYQNRLQKMMNRLQSSIYTRRRYSVLSLCAGIQDDHEVYLSCPMELCGIRKWNIMFNRDSSKIDSHSARSESLEFNGLHTPNTMSSSQDGSSTVSYKSKKKNCPR